MKIHVVSFHVPYPPNYGGAIDVFYKLKALKQAGYTIVFHTFLYDGEAHEALESLCERVYYYRRHTGVRRQLSLLPYNVVSRKDDELLAHLLSDDSPILFEGLHTCLYLSDPRLKDRVKMVRMHNIEHDYYRRLAGQTQGWRKLFLRLEADRFQRFESVLRHADALFAISTDDQAYLSQHFPDQEVRLLPCFFDDTFVEAEGGTEPYMLYHGNLAVAENVTAVQHVVRQVLPLLAPHGSFHLLVAGRNPSPALCRLAQQTNGVELVANPSQAQLNHLVENARINLLFTFQPTGIKLKLPHSLVKSRGYCLANDVMLKGNNLGALCQVANTPQEQADMIAKLMQSSPSPSDIRARQQQLLQLGYNTVQPITDFLSHN